MWPPKALPRRHSTRSTAKRLVEVTPRGTAGAESRGPSSPARLRLSPRPPAGYAFVMRARLAVVTTVIVLAGGGLALRLWPSAGQASSPAPRSSLHAAPAADLNAFNQATGLRLPERYAAEVLPDDRPGVVVFLKADCECSREFARMVAEAASQLATAASCLVVIEGDAAAADAFLADTKLSTRTLVEGDSRLAAAWSIAKAGCVALVLPDRSVEAIWPGISRQGLRDLEARLGLDAALSSDLLERFPGAAMAGCPLAPARLMSPED